MLSIKQVREIATQVRKEIIDKYECPDGHCIEASERIIEEFDKLGEKAQLVQGWVEYDDYSGCTDYSYAEHYWVEYGDLVIDVTGDQFNWAMYEDNECPEIFVGFFSMPHGWTKQEPINWIDEED